MGRGMGSGIEGVGLAGGGAATGAGPGMGTGADPPDAPIEGRTGGAEAAPMKTGGAPDAVPRCTV